MWITNHIEAEFYSTQLHGKILSFNQARLGIDPRPSIPISIMSRSPKLLELVGEIADGVVMGGFSSGASIEYGMKSVNLGLKKAGRDRKNLEICTWVTFTVDRNSSNARDFVMDGLPEKLWPGAKNFLQEAGVQIPVEIERLTSEFEMSKDSIYKCREMLSEYHTFADELVDHFTISGTPEHCIQKTKYVAGTEIDKIFINPVAPRRDNKSCGKLSARYHASGFLKEISANRLPVVFWSSNKEVLDISNWKRIAS